MKKIINIHYLFYILLFFFVILVNISLPISSVYSSDFDLDQVRKNYPFNLSFAEKENTKLINSQKTLESKNFVEGEILVKYKKDKINLKTSLGRSNALNFNDAKSIEKKEYLIEDNVSLLKIKDNKTVEQKIAELKKESKC